MDNVEALINFGLTRQEASIYLLLFSEGELNGYEVSKLTGISRSNAYNSLASLVEKGAAYAIEENTKKYIPVDIEEFCNNKLRFLNSKKKLLIDNIPKRNEEVSGYITIKGEDHIIDKFKNMILEAKERLYLSVSRDRMKDVYEELVIARDKKIKIVIITEEHFCFPGAKIYYKEKKSEDIRLIVDSTHVLTGKITDKHNSTCLYSSNSNLVDIFKEALTNEIKLIQLKEKER